MIIRSKVLVVEDDSEKARRVAEVVRSVIDQSEAIVHVTDAHSARIQLSRQRFDVAVIDVAIPSRIEAEIDGGSGVQLLKDIANRPEALISPSHCVVLTQYDELSHLADAAAKALGAAVTRYDRASTDWEQTLRGTIEHSIRTHVTSNRVPIESRTDVAIVTALSTPELDAMLRIPWNWRESRLADDPTTYHIGSAGRKTVVAASAPRMGMPAACGLTAKVISEWRPKQVIMIGIAAGVTDRVNLGDVVIADPTWDWGAGKWIKEGEQLRFQPDPHQVPLDVAVRQAVEPLTSGRIHFKDLMKDWGGDHPVIGPKVRIGPFASGASVLSDGQRISEVLDQNRKLLAVDMEAYGVCVACNEARGMRPTPLIIKAIVDFADGAKGDVWQRYAAAAAAQVARWYVEHVL